MQMADQTHAMVLGPSTDLVSAAALVHLLDLMAVSRPVVLSLVASCLLALPSVSAHLLGLMAVLVLQLDLAAVLHFRLLRYHPLVL